MHEAVGQLPATMESGETTIRSAPGWGGMVVGYVELPAGTDFTPMFEGLPGNACHCPHWGYVIKGSVHVRYTDGTEEVTHAGEVFYWPGGHTGWTTEDTVFLDFSPEKEHGEVMAHIASKAAEHE